MSSSDAKFAGSIPDLYEAHLGPLLFEPYADDLAARLPIPTGAGAFRVLEIAAGTGILTRRLRRRLPPTATLIATDLNEGMLQVARRRLEGIDGIEFRQADAMALPFPDASFDAVACQFGLMFMPDKPKAVREVRRVLTPGGTYLLNTWGSLHDNPASALTHEVLASLFPSNPPPFLKTPFGDHDPQALTTLLSEAGFTEIAITPVRIEGQAASAESAATGLIAGSPVFNQIVERGSPTPAEIIPILTVEFARAFGDRPMRSPMLALAITARRP
ncbi:MAG TPA: methyltransferase domain-containing protein [Candidatus Polarisedimenticolia bacterium]|nr:methyltransferase domain-containing protein [Candidatus Polarisedimenticolia bacterium]